MWNLQYMPVRETEYISCMGKYWIRKAIFIMRITGAQNLRSLIYAGKGNRHGIRNLLFSAFVIFFLKISRGKYLLSSLLPQPYIQTSDGQVTLNRQMAH